MTTTTLPNTPSSPSPKPITLDAIRKAAGYGMDDAHSLDAPPRGNGGNGGNSSGNHRTIDSTSPETRISAPARAIRIHPVPDDSILADAIAYNREVSEGPDSFTIAPILCLAGRLLTPDCHWNFAGRKYPNLYNFVVGPPGIRKSTSFGLAEDLAKQLLSPESVHDGSASDSALFERFESEAHMLQLEDEGNMLLEYWNRQGTGKELASRYLKLYDGKPWSQTFKKQGNADGGTTHRHIGCATLSFALGGTPNTAKFAGINNASGLRRRFGYYVALTPARRIAWPEPAGPLGPLVESFRRLKMLQGTHRLDDAAGELWLEIQDRFNDAQEEITGVDAVAEAKLAALSEAASRTLKLAGIFEACRWAKTGEGDGITVRADTLRTAFHHQLACLAAADEMETLGRRAIIQEEAELVLAGIRTDPRFPQVDGWHCLTRSELTNKFARHSGRLNCLTPHQLYAEIIPHLQGRGLCGPTEKSGKLERYLFVAETAI
jgi:hypothetical protein